MLVMFFMRIKFDITVKFLSTELRTVQHTQIFKIYCKLHSIISKQREKMKHAHKIIIKQGINVCALLGLNTRISPVLNG